MNNDITYSVILQHLLYIFFCYIAMFVGDMAKKVKSKGKEVMVSNRIKEFLTDTKNQTWLADQLGVDFVTVNRYVNNHNQPSLERLGKIASLLGVKLKDLIND